MCPAAEGEEESGISHTVEMSPTAPLGMLVMDQRSTIRRRVWMDEGVQLQRC